MKKIISMIMVLAFASVAYAQDKAAAKPSMQATQAPQASADPIVIAAGDVSIRQSEFESAVKTLPPEYAQFASGPGKRQFAEDYLRMKMLAAQGMKSGLDKDPEVVRQMSLMRENLVANAQLARIEKGIAVSDADLQKAYEANKKEYETVKARHILVTFKGSPVPVQAGKKELTEEEAKAKAEALRAQITAGGKFEEIAKKESDDAGSGANGGDLGAFRFEQMVEEFAKAAFGAKKGEVTPVVRTQFGYHIIKVEDHTTTPFADVKAQLEKTERQRKVQEALDAMKSTAKPTFNEAYFNAPAATPAAEPMKKQ